MRASAHRGSRENIRERHVPSTHCLVVVPFPWLSLSPSRFQEEIQRLKDQLAGQGGGVDGDGEVGQVRKNVVVQQ